MGWGLAIGIACAAAPSVQDPHQKSTPQKGFNLIGGQDGEFVLNEFNDTWKLLYRDKDVTKKVHLKVTAVDKHLSLTISIDRDSNLPPLPQTFNLQNTNAGAYVCLTASPGCAAEIESWTPKDLE